MAFSAEPPGAARAKWCALATYGPSSSPCSSSSAVPIARWSVARRAGPSASYRTSRTSGVGEAQASRIVAHLRDETPSRAAPRGPRAPASRAVRRPRRGPRPGSRRQSSRPDRARPRTAGESRARRWPVTSRTEGGTPSGAETFAVSRSSCAWLARSRTISLTKKGLPPVSRSIASITAGDGRSPPSPRRTRPARRLEAAKHQPLCVCIGGRPRRARHTAAGRE